MKTLFSFLIFSIFTLGIVDILQGQDVYATKTSVITVSGSAELEVEPDEIRFQLGIQEYWKEEFEKGMEYKDFVTKVPLEEIEKSVMDELKKVGITQENMFIKEVGNNWMESGKGFRKSKVFEILLTDFKKVDEIIANVKTRGVNLLQVSELKNKKIAEYRKQVKIEALKAAKDKAGYLLESIGQSVGKVISITETGENTDQYLYPWRPQKTLSNAYLGSTSDNSVNSDMMRKIFLQYGVTASFEIK